MTVTFSKYRDITRAMLPPWLLGTYGEKLMVNVLGLQADDVADEQLSAIQASWLLSSRSPDDALPLVGSERRMPRYPSEVTAAYRSRLHGAWDAYQFAGCEQTLIDQLVAFGFTPTAGTIAALTLWTASGVTVAMALGPDSTSNAIVITEDSATSEHYVTAAASAVPTGKLVDVSFKARVDATRPWLRVALGTAYAYVNTQLRTTGTASYGTATVRGYRVGGWVFVRARFWSTSATPTVKINLASGDGTISYAGNGTSSASIADLTIRTPDPEISTATDLGVQNELHPVSSTAWWSRFWVRIYDGTHDSVGTSTAEVIGIRNLCQKWKPAEWVCEEVQLYGSGGMIWGQFVWGAGDLWGSTTVEIVTVD